ncbi:MAG: hypothetical protein M1831_003884 [Alyxoria varia]|nr:MAG: hypothetical protein M1831_003884 [Alyxoria varia]
MVQTHECLGIICLISVTEGYGILHFAPELRPTGGLGRLSFSLFFLNAGLLIFYHWFIWPFFLNPLRKLPGPSGGNLFIGHGMMQFKRPPGDRCRVMMNTIPNDGIIHFRSWFNKSAVMPTTHETLRTVLSENPYDYEKPPRYIEALRRILGHGLILVEGGVHRFQRKHLMPSFQLGHIRNLYPLFWLKASELVSVLTPPGEKGTFELDFGNWCLRATLDIIGVAGLGRDFDSLNDPNNELAARYANIVEPDFQKTLWFGLHALLPHWFIRAIPWRINRETDTASQELYNFALQIVKDRRQSLAAPKSVDANHEHHDDILSLLVKSNDFTHSELANQVLTFMAAGHETTSSALSWCSYLLSLHPEVQRELRDEIRSDLSSPRDKSQQVSAAQIDSLPLLNAVCNETTRLYPTVPVTIRVVVRETPLGNEVLPVGTTVLMSPWATNRSHHHWGPDADEFRPQRWINEDGTPNNTGGSRSNYSLMTFLHGPRSCIGQGFARSELKCLLAAFVGIYEFELARPVEDYFPAGMITTKPNGGMWLKMNEVGGW